MRVRLLELGQKGAAFSSSVGLLIKLNAPLEVCSRVRPAPEANQGTRASGEGTL
jgi:hypothetical protein